MFCDLVGSTALSARLDPEDMREIIGAYHRCCAEQITKAGGFVAKFMGDGVLAYFGYPQAHEDDAERAVRAGLSLAEAVPKLPVEHDAKLEVRVGIATGLVVVGDLIGEGDAQERGVVGDTPNLAARLQSLAEPGQVVISNGTRRLTGGMFDYRDLRRVTLKGLADPVQAWQVLGSSTVESRFEAQRGAALTPLVGREEELELLLRRWQQAKAGDGSVVLILGEPGIGKSRLAQTLLERLSDEPYTRLRQFCSPHHQDTALYPTIAQLERAAGFRRDDTDEQRLEKLEAVLAQATNDLSEAVPLLAALLSIPIGDHYRALDLTPQKLKEKTLKALVAQVEGLVARQPVLMVVEDAHWIDPTSLELLDLTVDRVPRLPVLLIITFRPEFAPPWVGRSHVTSLILNRLPPRQRAEMVARVTEGKALPREIADQIVERTDGIPLFIEELTKAIVESGDLADAGDHYTAKRSMSSLAIPTTLHASLLARLDRLAPVREVAQIGAALGRNFSHELISAVVPMQQKQLDDALAQLVSAELVFRRGTPPDAEYVFKHALVQDAAYSTLLRGRRQQLHARIASTLESRFPEIVATHPALLAQHWTAGGQSENAVGYRLKAGQQAVVRSAMTEAVAQLQKGLGLVADLPETPRRAQQELDLQIALGRALSATRGYSSSAVGETIGRARALAEQLDRPDHLVPVLFLQYVFHYTRAEHKLGLALAEEIEKFGEAQNNEATLQLGHWVHGIIRFELGHFVTARALFEQCHGLRDPSHRAAAAALMAQDSYAGMLAHLGVTLAFLGHFDQARARVNEALSETRRLGHAYTLVFVLTWVCWAAWAGGLPHEARRYAEEAIALSNEHGFPFLLGFVLLHRGWSLIALGHAQEGFASLTEGRSVLSSVGAAAGSPWALTLLAEAHAELGRPFDGLDCLAEAAQIAHKTDDRYGEAELHRLRGQVLSATGNCAAAEQSYHQALTVAKSQSAKPFELRAATSLARLWRDQGKRTEARDLLAPIYGWFTEGFDTPVLKEAKTLLEELG
jgi:class 3 adenylate cyclase/tetratricopeptide (TPR) repeat protein